MCGCGIWGRGLVMDLAVLGLWLDLILKLFSNLNDSTISLCFFFAPWRPNRKHWL